MQIFKGGQFYLHFSNTYKHQDLEINSSLYYEDFCWEICLYIILADLYNILHLKTW